MEVLKKKKKERVAWETVPLWPFPSPTPPPHTQQCLTTTTKFSFPDSQVAPGPSSGAVSTLGKSGSTEEEGETVEEMKACA